MKEYNFTINGNKYHVSIDKVEGQTIDVEVNGTPYSVEVDQEIRQPMTTKTPKLVRSVASSVPSTDATPQSAKTNKGGAINSPLPGTILDIYVKEGDKVTAGQKLLLLEAMKMENNIDSDKEGTITSVKVRKGDAVMEGDVLIMID
ncbi:MAG: biotin/lipoyl-binding protein [Bacteroidales bacterium]|nr:biotin/lipoyl-binding protein [Bacteroidales bacterium]